MLDIKRNTLIILMYYYIFFYIFLIFYYYFYDDLYLYLDLYCTLIKLIDLIVF